MKRLNFSIALVLICVMICQHAEAKIRRVGYFGAPISGTDYTSIQAAHDAANSGDTLYIFPGTYGNSTITKKLIIIGYGYFVNGAGKNDGLQVVTGSLSATIVFGAGSDSSILEGLDGLAVGEIYYIPLKHIVINRCSGTVNFNGGTYTDWQITQSSVSIYNGYLLVPVLQNLLVSNSIVGNFSASNAASTGVLINNIFGNNNLNFQNASFSFINNIFLSSNTPANIANSTFQNNIATNNTIPAANNQPNVNLSTIFVGYPTQGTNSSDGAFVLKPGSPAIGAGQGGVDCGVFGGPNPYHLSGIPPIPSFYKLTSVSGTATNSPYTITFSVRSNN